jgi:hypothetical protein
MFSQTPKLSAEVLQKLHELNALMCKATSVAAYFDLFNQFEVLKFQQVVYGCRFIKAVPDQRLGILSPDSTQYLLDVTLYTHVPDDSSEWQEFGPLPVGFRVGSVHFNNGAPLPKGANEQSTYTVHLDLTVLGGLAATCKELISERNAKFGLAELWDDLANAEVLNDPRNKARVSEIARNQVEVLALQQKIELLQAEIKTSAAYLQSQVTARAQVIADTVTPDSARLVELEAMLPVVQDARHSRKGFTRTKPVDSLASRQARYPAKQGGLTAAPALQAATAQALRGLSDAP